MMNKGKGDCMKDGKGKTPMRKHNESLKKVINGKAKAKPRGKVIPGGMAPDSKG